MRIHTIGYSKTSMEEFLEKLKEANVGVLVDVRDNANSTRKTEFSKHYLRDALHENGIQYFHYEALGNPKPKSGNRTRESFVESGQLKTDSAADCLADIVDMVSDGKSVCLMCLCADFEKCHMAEVVPELQALYEHLVDLEDFEHARL